MSWLGVAFVLSGSATIITWYATGKDYLGHPLTIDLESGANYSAYSAPNGYT